MLTSKIQKMEGGLSDILCHKRTREVILCTEVDTECPGQALILISEDGPKLISRALSEI